jgi:hypothetical protein
VRVDKSKISSLNATTSKDTLFCRIEQHPRTKFHPETYDCVVVGLSAANDWTK